MGPKDMIRRVAQSNDAVVNAYLADFSDTDLLVRPVEQAHHVAWQLGHLIQSEQSLLKTAAPSALPIELPAGWDKQYTAETAGVNPPAGFATKAEYLALYQRSRANVMKALADFPDADFD